MTADQADLQRPFTRVMLGELYGALFNSTTTLANVADINFATAQKAVEDPSAKLSQDTIRKLRSAYYWVVKGTRLSDQLDAIHDFAGPDVGQRTIAGNLPDVAGGFVPTPGVVTRRCDGCQREREVPGGFYKYFKDRPELRPTCKYCLSLERVTRRLGMHRAERFQFFRTFLGEVRWPPDPENSVWVERAKDWVRRRANPLDSDSDHLKPPKRALNWLVDDPVKAAGGEPKVVRKKRPSKLKNGLVADSVAVRAGGWGPCD